MCFDRMVDLFVTEWTVSSNRPRIGAIFLAEEIRRGKTNTCTPRALPFEFMLGTLKHFGIEIGTGFGIGFEVGLGLGFWLGLGIVN